MENLWVALALAGMYIGFLAVLELSRRKFGTSAEITRRIAHIVTGLCTLLNFYVLPAPWFLSLAAVALIGGLISQRFGILTSIHSVTRRTYGEIFLPIGAIASYAVCSGKPEVYVPSILIMTFADSFAGLVSNYYKQPRKMFRGSVVFFSVTLVILLATNTTNIGWALLISAGLTLVERISPLGSDNFTVPVASALVLFML
ncbi:MAG: hypothetical protein KGQ56_02155 [Acidobacteria bacterium]|nr:hypothetical protein [Acidobacteriota bacterium]